MVFAVLFIVINSSVSSSVENNAVESLQTAATDRSEIISNYIQSTEDALTAYLKAGQIYDLLRDPENTEAFNAAQAYTEKFSADLDGLEGIYASRWDTTTLTHTSKSVIGITTRKDADRLKQLHDAISSGKVYNAGIIISPASGEQIISMYKAVIDDDGSAIGLGGIGIYTSGLVSTLDQLPMSGFDNASYCLVNAATGEYIFHPNAEKVTTVADEKYVNDIISAVKSDPGRSGSLSYSENGVKYTAAYKGISGQGWVFIVSDEYSELMASVTSMRILLAVICVVGLVLLALVAYLVIGKLV